MVGKRAPKAGLKPSREERFVAWVFRHTWPIVGVLVVVKLLVILYEVYK